MTKQQTVYNPALKYQVLTGDCVEVMKSLPAGAFNALVTDPPYGTGDVLGKPRKQPGKSQWRKLYSGGTPAWNAETCVHAITVALSRCRPKSAIVWGGQFYPLPPQRGWLIWDKIVRQWTSGHCEMAWSNLDQPVRAYSYSFGQLASEGKEHPTQKPVPLMRWCCHFLPRKAIVLDPFCGSGSTGVACKQLGIPFIGIELDPKWADIARRRLSETREPWIASPKTITPPKKRKSP